MARIHFTTLTLLLLASGSAFAAEPVCFYVSPGGNDAWSGKLPAPNATATDGPFATVDRARQAVREARMADPRPRPYTVFLRGGMYPLAQTLVFTPEDSGSADAPITYVAYGDGTPILSGGRTIEGWTETPDGLWVAEVPEVRAGNWYFHQLFVNGERRPRARHPNAGYLRTAGPLPEIENPQQPREDAAARIGFTYRPGDLQRWEGLEEVNVILYYDWDTSLHWIAALDEEAHTVRFTNPSQWPVCYWERDQRYHLENFRAALDQPGEWFLDRQAGRLYYWPWPGEDPNEATFIAPFLSRLVELRGEPEQGRFVQHLHFQGLSFQYADWVVGRDQCAQAQAAAFLRAAFLAQGARHCRVDRCEIAHVGEYGLWFERGCQDNRIFHCELHDLGGGGVRLGPEGYLPEEPLRTERNSVDNCFLHDGGHVFAPAVGIWIGQSGHNTITHNEISDFYYTGISAGWSWGYGPSLSQYNVIERNHVHHLGFGVLSELSAIYTLGVSEGTRICHNLLHDTYDYRYGSWGLGLDEGTSYVLVEGNLLYHHGHGAGLHYGRDNVLRNNIIALSRNEEFGIGRVEEHVGVRLERNIFLSNNGLLMGSGMAQRKFESDDNLFWDTDLGADLDLDGLLFDEWQGLGWDQHSLVADPQFRDVANFDFHLSPTSPAFKLGFQPLDWSDVGLYGEPEWVAKPRQIHRPPLALPPAPPARPRELADDFEDAPVGDHPQGAAISGEERGASIRISDETAAGGRHSLKFTDAPGLPATWQPHLFYRPVIVRGIAHLAFDVRLEAGAVLVHQWRDWRAGETFQVGPTLTFHAGGDLLAHDRRVTDAPVGVWLHVEITCPIGRDAPRTYRLTVTLPGQEPITLADLPIPSEGFRQLNWLGFISEANDTAVLYVDNLQLRHERSP